MKVVRILYPEQTEGVEQIGYRGRFFGTDKNTYEDHVKT